MCDSWYGFYLEKTLSHFVDILAGLFLDLVFFGGIADVNLEFLVNLEEDLFKGGD